MASTAVEDGRLTRSRAVPRDREQQPDHKTAGGRLMLYVAHLIEAKGTTVDKVAAKSGIHRATIFRWLRGQGEPTVTQLEALAKALGYTDFWRLKPPKDFDTK